MSHHHWHECKDMGSMAGLQMQLRVLVSPETATPLEVPQ